MKSLLVATGAISFTLLYFDLGLESSRIWKKLLKLLGKQEFFLFVAQTKQGTFFMLPLAKLERAGSPSRYCARCFEPPYP
jgi:hypothetical protein